VKARYSVWLSRDLKQPTVKFVDEYCQWYQTLFVEVRSFEAFKQLHIGLISEVKRKSLPAIATVVAKTSLNRCIIFYRIPWQVKFLDNSACS